MCWSEGATLAMVALGGAATVVTARRGEALAIPLALGYFTAMEALQLAGYWTLDQCGTPANRAVTLLSYVHIAFQPLFINAFAMAIAPRVVSPAMRKAVFALAALAAAAMLFRLIPVGWIPSCAPGDALCGEVLCTRSGTWHLAWDVPLTNPWAGIHGLLGGHVQFPSYILAVFVLPLVYGAWRFVLFHLAFGPVLASLLTTDPNEMPAIWCLFSIALVLVGLSPMIRTRLLAAPPVPATR